MVYVVKNRLNIGIQHIVGIPLQAQLHMLLSPDSIRSAYRNHSFRKTIFHPITLLFALSKYYYQHLPKTRYQ